MEGKKIKGRKRHIVTDTQGHILHVKVHAANIHDTVAGCDVFKVALEKYPTLLGVCADAGYRKTMENFVKNVCKKTIEISTRITQGWAIIAKNLSSQFRINLIRKLNRRKYDLFKRLNRKSVGTYSTIF